MLPLVRLGWKWVIVADIAFVSWIKRFVVVGSFVVVTALISSATLGWRWVCVGGVEFILLIKNFCVVGLFVAVLRKACILVGDSLADSYQNALKLQDF